MDCVQPKLLSVTWLILGLTIFTGNIFTSYILWRSKISREKSEIGSKFHSAWNLICMELAFSLLGLTLVANMATVLATNDELSDGLCNFYGFLHAIGFNFILIAIIVAIINKLYSIISPFRYRVYTKGKSNVPMFIFIGSTLYSLLAAIIPLTSLGYYYQTKYAICLLHWGKDTATRITVILNLIALLTIVYLIILYIRLVMRLHSDRRQLNVPITRRKETMIFQLVISSLIITCWCPYIVSVNLYMYAIGPGKITAQYVFPLRPRAAKRQGHKRIIPSSLAESFKFLHLIT